MSRRTISPPSRALAEDVERWMADEPVSACREPRARRALGGSSGTGRRSLGRRGSPGRGCWAAAVLAVQTRAKGAIARALVNETRANAALSEANHRVEERYALATEAIKTFHTGVSENFLLKEEKFKDLRQRLLTSAADFYGRLSALLGPETDFASRRALHQATFELADLTAKIGRTEDALCPTGRCCRGGGRLRRSRGPTPRPAPTWAAASRASHRCWRRPGRRTRRWQPTESRGCWPHWRPRRRKPCLRWRTVVRV